MVSNSKEEDPNLEGSEVSGYQVSLHDLSGSEDKKKGNTNSFFHFVLFPNNNFFVAIHYNFFFVIPSHIPASFSRM